MKNRIIQSLVILLICASFAIAEYFPDVIVTSPNGIWTDTRAYSSLDDALIAIGSNVRDLYIVEQEPITTATIHANTHLKFFGSGSIANSGLLTINTKNISAGNRQIFTGTGDIDFYRGSVIRSSWFSDLVEAINQTNGYYDYLTLIISEESIIDTDVAIGDKTVLKWESPRNRITINSGFTLSNIKRIEAGNYQIFTGSGDIDFLDGSELKLSWFKRLRSALTWIELETITIIIDKSEDLDTSETVDSNENLRFISGNILDGASGTETLTINSSIESGIYQIVGDSLLIAGSPKVEYIYPEWVGAIGDGITDDSSAIEKAMSINALTKILPGKTYNIASNISIPLNRTLILDGTLTGLGGLRPLGSFKLKGSGNFNSSIIASYSVMFISGDCEVSGITFTGANSYAIGIIPSTDITKINIHDNYFNGVIFGVLRNTSAADVLSAIISNNIFKNTLSDAIEWNQGPGDRNILISENTIRDIDSVITDGGIGIGVSGSIGWTDPRLSELSIVNNIITNVRQGIHVEMCSNVKIMGNNINGINKNLSTTTGIPAVGIVVYGSDNVNISENDVTTENDEEGILCLYGVSLGVYVESIVNPSVINNKVKLSSYTNAIYIEAAGNNNEAIIKDNLIINGKITIDGKTSTLIISNNFISTPAESAGMVFNIDRFNISGDGADPPNYIFVNSNFISDNLGVPNIIITSLSAGILDVTNNNFQFIGSTPTTDSRCINRLFYKSASGFPYGIEYQLGDIVFVSADNTISMVTVAGSFNRASDTFTTNTISGDTDLIKSTNLLWWNGAEHHESGQRISLTNIGPASATLEARVKRCYVSGGEHLLQLDRDWSTVNTGTITATNPVTVVPF